MLYGAYLLDVNVSHDGLGSPFRPEPGTIVGELTERVRATYGSLFSSLSTNGTTASNVLMIGTAMVDGHDIILNRASHTSLYGAMVIFDAHPHYLPTRLDPTFGVPLGASLQEVAALMEQTPEASAVALTAPNYFGVVPPLRDIVAEVHRRGKLCVVDAAHGAHFRASSLLPEPVEASGADLVTHSIHKTSAALGQASLLHCYSRLPEVRTRFFEVLNTIPVLSTSFSVPILLSVEIAIEDLANEAAWARAVECAQELRERLDQVHGCRVVRLPVPQSHAAAQDPTRVVVDVSQTGIDGHRFAHLLAEQQVPAFRQIAEMSTLQHLVFIVTSAVTPTAVQRLALAFERVVREHGKLGHTIPPAQPPRDLPPMVLTPRKAFTARRRRRLPVMQAARSGCVAAETVSTYPPGAPIFVAGEQLRPEDIDYLRAVRSAGAALKGATDPSFETVTVIDI
jgi:lysine decarboxylase